jgi:hypothetical protein
MEHFDSSIRRTDRYARIDDRAPTAVVLVLRS